MPYLIKKYRSKSASDKEKKKTKSENQIYLIYNDKDDYRGRGLIKSTLLSSLFDFIAEGSIFLFYFFNDEPNVLSIYNLNSFLIINTVTQYIASYIVLKTYFYKHHYLSFIINTFCILITLIIDIIQIVNKHVDEYKYYIYVIMRLIRLTLYCFGNCYSKMALYSAFLSPFALLLYKALYETAFLIIYSIPFIFIKMSDLFVDNQSIFVGFKEYFTGIKILYSILLFVIDFLNDMVLMIIIDKFSPSNLTLAFILESFGFSVYTVIIYSIRGRDITWSLIVNFPICIILFIGAMIHNEIFIINKWGLNLKTKLYLDSKFEEEKLNFDINPEENEEDDPIKTEEKEDKGILMQDIGEKD